MGLGDEEDLKDDTLQIALLMKTQRSFISSKDPLQVHQSMVSLHCLCELALVGICFQSYGIKTAERDI